MAAAICFVAVVTSKSEGAAVQLCSESNIFAGSYVDNAMLAPPRLREETVVEWTIWLEGLITS